MLTRKPTVGGGAGFSGACRPASAWRVLRPLPGPLRFSAKATRGPAPDAHLFEPLHLTPCSPEVTVTSLHSSRLCRLAIFFIHLLFGPDAILSVVGLL